MNYIYCMRNPLMMGMVKIGFSANVQRRKAQLSDNAPMDFILLKSWKVKDGRFMERKIHERLELYRITARREYFAVSAEAACLLIDAMVDLYGRFPALEQSGGGPGVVVSSMEAMGIRIRREREAKRLTQVEVAKRAGVSRQWLMSVEGGKEGIEAGLLFKVLGALEMGIELKRVMKIVSVDIDAIIEAHRKPRS